MRKFLLILFMILLITIFPNSSFAQDSLNIPRWIVQSKLLENGNLEVSEDITFNFNDKFNGVFRYIVLEGINDIQDLQLFQLINGQEVEYIADFNASNGDSNVYNYDNNSKGLNLKIFSPSENETKTFRIKYTLVNVAVMHSDTGEFYYKYLGEDNETPIGYFSATLELPQLERDRVKIFAHGPLNGTINFLNNNLIKLEVNNVDANTFVEARVLYPLEYTPLSTKSGSNTFDNILTEEESFVADLAERAVKRETNRGIFNQLSLILAALGAIVTGFVYKITKRDPSIFERMDSLHPKDISPAELNLFMNQVIDARGLMASIFDLAGKEYLKIEEVDNIYSKKGLQRKEFILTRLDNKKDSSLLEHEKYLLNWLINDIGDGRNVTTIEIENARTKTMVKFNKSQAQWNRLVSTSLNHRGYFDTRSKKIGGIILILSLPIFIVGVFALIYGGIYGVAALMISMILFVYSLVVMTRKSDEGYIEYGLWKDYKKNINKFNELENEIPRDKTMIYALALGHTMMKLDSYRRNHNPDYFPLYWGYAFFIYNRKGGSVFEDRFNNSFYGNTGTSSATTSTFGGGGGFSGGGGGGFGGGGAGGF